MWKAFKEIFYKKTVAYVNPKFLNEGKQTILVIDDDLPQHDKSSGSKRLFELLKLLKTLHFNIVFFPNDGLATEPYQKDLENLQIGIFLAGTGKSDQFVPLAALLPKIDFVWISRPLLNHKFQHFVRKNSTAKIIFDTVDLHYVRMLRQADEENNQKLRSKALKTKKLELALAASANATVVVTDVEKAMLEAEGITNVHTIPNVHEIKQLTNEFAFEMREGIVFIGGYKHEPNVDAVKWLVNEIMPIVWRELKDVQVFLLGSHPPLEVQNLAGNLVHVPGYLEDVSNYFNTSRLFVAPLRYGAGMKGKIGQSLEFGLPIVTTSIGAEGMDLIDGEQVSIANTTQEFANKIITLYEDSQLWHHLKANATTSIMRYSPANVKTMLSKLLNQLNGR